MERTTSFLQTEKKFWIFSYSIKKKVFFFMGVGRQNIRFIITSHLISNKIVNQLIIKKNNCFHNLIHLQLVMDLFQSVNVGLHALSVHGNLKVKSPWSFHRIQYCGQECQPHVLNRKTPSPMLYLEELKVSQTQG